METNKITSVTPSTSNIPIEALIKVKDGDYSNEDCIEKIINYISNHPVNNYFFGAGCSDIPAETIHDFQSIRKIYNKTDGKQVKHIIISFRPHDDININSIPIIANQIVNFFYGSHQVAYAIHMENRELEYGFHIHMVINYINYSNGNLYHNSFTTINNFIKYIEALPYNIQIQKANNYF